MIEISITTDMIETFEKREYKTFKSGNPIYHIKYNKCTIYIGKDKEKVINEYNKIAELTEQELIKLCHPNH